MTAEKPELEEYTLNLSGYDRVIFAFVCQSGSGAEKAFAKLAKTLEIDKIEKQQYSLS